jgi:hypothetical protein
VIGHSDPAGDVEETEAEFAYAEGGCNPNIFSNTPLSQCRPCKFEIRASVVPRESGQPSKGGSVERAPVYLPATGEMIVAELPISIYWVLIMVELIGGL